MEIHGEKQSWKHNGKNFAVEVVWWKDASYQAAKESLPPELFDGVPENHWNVYAYIYPKHPFFDKIVSESFYDYGVDLPLHCGSSFHKWYYNAKGEVLYKKIGSDYQHYQDDRFERYKTKEEAWQVFNDATELIEMLKNQEAPAAIEEMYRAKY